MTGMASDTNAIVMENDTSVTVVERVILVWQ